MLTKQNIAKIVISHAFVLEIVLVGSINSVIYSTNVLPVEAEGTQTLQTNGGRVFDMFRGDDERGVGVSGVSYGNASYVSDKVEVLV